MALSLGLTFGSHAALDPGDALFKNGVMPHLEIEVSDAGMKTLRDYDQVWGQPHPERIDVRATVRDGRMVYTNVALHLKGSFTFQPVEGKPSLTLNFDKFAPGQRFRGLDKIHLNNSVQDPAFICEKLARELFVEAGVPATRIGHARVSLNDRSLGFYVLVEGYDKRFLKRHFASTKGNLYDGGSRGDIAKNLEVDSGEDRENRSDVTALLAATREKNPSVRLARLEQVPDVDRFLTFAALEVLLQHWDGYCLGPNNFRLFHDAATGKMVFLPHGMDQILGTGRSSSVSITPKWDGLVARALFSTPEGRQRYLERVAQVFTNQFRPEVLTARVDQMAGHIHSGGGLGLLARIRHQAAVESLKARIYSRAEQVGEQLARLERPLVFGADGVVRISGWQFKESSNGSVTGQRGRTNGLEFLGLRSAGNEWTSGSWRKLVLLEAGHYEFSAMARATGLPADATNSGVILRVSGERDAAGLSNNEDWTRLSYEFDVSGLINAELICEFRGAAGLGMFDVSTIKLRRMPSVTLTHEKTKTLSPR